MHEYNPTGYSRDMPQEVYRSWSNALYPNFKFVYPDGRYSLQTNQSIVKLAAYTKERAQDIYSELLLWTPHIKPEERGEKEGNKRYISIFEHNLSLHASYDLELPPDVDINVDSFARIASWSHYRYGVYFEGTLKEALMKIKKELYYEKGKHK